MVNPLDVGISNENTSPNFSRNSEASASEFLENLDEMLFTWC